LYSEFYESGGYFGKGHDEPGEINLAKDVGIVLKCFGGGVEALGKVIPEGDSGQVEQCSGYAIGTDLGDVAKNQDVDGGGEDGLHHKPDGTQDGLFVNGDDIPLNEHVEQVAVIPDFLEIDVECMPLGADDEVVIFSHWYL